VVALALLLGVVETLSAGLGWSPLRAAAAIVIVGVLLLRRRAPLAVSVVVAGVTLATAIALRLGGHGLPLSGLTIMFVIYALVRWAPGREVAVGLSVVAAHAIAFHLVDPNSHMGSTILLYGGPAVVAYVARSRPDRHAVRWFDVAQLTGVAMVLVALFAATQGAYVADQVSSYVTRTRSPEVPDDWLIDDVTLRRAAEASQGTHVSAGAIHHTVDYPYQLLAAIESPTLSVEANVTVIDGTAFLQHDPRDPVGMPLLEFLEYSAIARFPVVKLDLKRDRVGTIITEVQQAIDQFGLDVRRLQFNADVFRGPGVSNDFIGARSDMSFIDRMYNLLVMELETADLARIAERFPDSTIVISAFTPTGSLDHGYSDEHLERFIRAAEDIREASPDQSLAFALRGDLAALSGPQFLATLTAVEDGYVAAWWSADVRPTQEELDTLRASGVTFFDPGPPAED